MLAALLGRTVVIAVVLRVTTLTAALLTALLLATVSLTVLLPAFLRAVLLRASLLRGTILLGATILAVRLTILLILAIALLRAALALLRLAAVFRALAPALVVAITEATADSHGLDHAEIVLRILPVGLGQDAVARGRCLAGQRLVLVEDLVRVAAYPDVGTTAVEKLVAVGRTVRIVVMLGLAVVRTTAATATAAPTAAVTTAARSLPIVRSHSEGLIPCQTGMLLVSLCPLPGAVTAFL